MIGSAISPLTNPNTNWIPAMLGLAFPYIFVSNSIFILYWVLRQNKFYLISLIALIIGANNLNHFVQFNLKSTENYELPKILSFNIKAFNLIVWRKDPEQKKHIINFLEKENADIICIQEFLSSKNKNSSISTSDTILSRTSTLYCHEKFTYNVYNKFFFGMATFSKYPIINEGEIIFKNSKNACIYSDIKIKEDTIRVFNVHLQSVHFEKDDYILFDSLEVLKSEKINRAKGILSKLKTAFKFRANQVDILNENIKNSPYPVMVCGDLNDNPISYSYKNLTTNLQDAFAELGMGIGATHNGNIPFLRIDYILHSSNISVSNFDINENMNSSDHFPISCRFEIKK